ncbi:MAG: hypothetical protein ABI992_05820 [Chthoniobacterales bacterium]
MSSHLRFAWLLPVFFLFAIVAAGSQEENEIADLYRRGLGGDPAAVIACIAKLEAALQITPTNQVARAYLGSALTLRSRDLGFGPKKLTTLQDGLATMDAAVKAAPDDPKVRLVRALTTGSLPAFFGRGASTRKDFALLAERADHTPERFSAGDLQIIYYHAALAAKTQGDHGRQRLLLAAANRHPADAKLAEKITHELSNLP